MKQFFTLGSLLILLASGNASLAGETPKVAKRITIIEQVRTHKTIIEEYVQAEPKAAARPRTTAPTEAQADSYLTSWDAVSPMASNTAYEWRDKDFSR